MLLRGGEFHRKAFFDAPLVLYRFAVVRLSNRAVFFADRKKIGKLSGPIQLGNGNFILFLHFISRYNLSCTLYKADTQGQPFAYRYRISKNRFSQQASHIFFDFKKNDCEEYNDIVEDEIEENA